MPRARAPSTASEEAEVSSIPQQQQQQQDEQELGSMYDYLAKVILVGPSGAGKSCLLHRFINRSFRVLSSQTIGVEFSSKVVRVGQGAQRKRVKLQLWDTAGTERFRSVSRSYYRGAAGAILVYDVARAQSLADLATFLLDARALASPRLVCALAGNKADLAEAAAAAGSVRPKPSSGSLAVSATAFAASSARSTHSYASQASTIRSIDSVQTVGGGGGGGAEDAAGIKWTSASTSSEGRQVSGEMADRWASQNGGVAVCMEVSALTGENVDELFSRLAGIILTKIELGEIDPDDPRSGIQYGDGYGVGADGGGGGGGGGGSSSTLRRRKKRGGGVVLGDWLDVFHASSSSSANRSAGRCC